ncbi:MAG: MarR family transcriptional regulator [Candidatus Marinimicrobia bacterium]|nr:MarR family transcriptional regulator [Candidatus Neomarinimicrobiota bacterium]MBL7023196.1 MarR family transcriptional regulator [Candidatus Neomarinimicrobiota bacterium]MBL7109251.1 MarR family transcriptional regulator [Candidatus Neomarinimicrobiota bacterium]
MKSKHIDNISKLSDLVFNLTMKCEEKEQIIAQQNNLTRTEFRCLRIIFKALTVEKLNINNKDISDIMKLTPSRLTRIIDGLVNKNYLLREIDKSDRRNIRFSLTNYGLEKSTLANQEFLDIHEQILNEVDPEMHSILVSGMEHFFAAVKKVIDNQIAQLSKTNP